MALKIYIGFEVTPKNYKQGNKKKSSLPKTMK